MIIALLAIIAAISVLGRKGFWNVIGFVSFLILIAIHFG